jgi:PAS domain S-box-containing protein
MIQKGATGSALRHRGMRSFPSPIPMPEAAPLPSSAGASRPSSPPPMEVARRIAHDIVHVLTALQEPVLFLDREWRFTYFNQSAGRISRLRPEDLHGKTHWELFPDTLGTEIERKYRRVMSDRVEEHVTFFYRRFEVWLDIRIVPIETGLALLYSDVTARKMEEQARRAMGARLEQVLDVTTDAVLYLDRDYRLTFLNRRARELLSPSGDVLGAILWDAFPAAGDKTSLYYTNYRLTMEQGVPTEFDSFYPEPLNRWYSNNCVAAGDGMILFFRDITEERQDKESLRLKQLETERQHAEIEAVYRTAPVGLALFDPVEFRYLRLNNRQAEFYGLPPEQILGRSVTEQTTIAVRELFEQVAKGTPVHDHLIEGELTSRPGEHRYWTVNYDPIFAPDGSVQAISAVSQEVTRQKQAEAALIQSEKLAAVGRLATSISHEINNPLEAITNILYLIATSDELPDSLRNYIDIAQDEVARVSQIATQTLRFHRQSARPTLVEASTLVDPVLDLYQGRLANSGIAVDARYASRTPFLCFENDIRQVLNNLIANAIDAMRSGGRLSVRAHDATEHKTGKKGVRLTIADTGHGMSRATMIRIFEPFYTTKDLNGTGLGLWISAEIMTRHGGRLTVRSSQAPTRRGTVFSLYLPLVGE